MRRTHATSKPPIDWEILERYFTGEASETDVKTALRMLTAYPHLAPLLDRALNGPGTEFDSTTQFAQLQQRMDSPKAALLEADKSVRATVTTPESTAKKSLSAPLEERLPKRRINWPSAFTGAGIVGALMLTVFTLTQFDRLGSPTNDVGPLQEYATPKGARATVRLTDGTRVILAADSRLRYARSFGDHDRTVWLEGEAYLDVAPLPNKPFQVMAGPSLIRVLGTSFIVRAREDEATARVVVESGAISFRHNPIHELDKVGAVTLRPGDMGQLESSGAVQVTRVADVHDYISWTAGKLVMRSAPLQSVVRELERWYDLDITVEDPTALTVPVTMTFDDVSADVGLQRLADALNMRYTRTGKVVRLKP